MPFVEPVMALSSPFSVVAGSQQPGKGDMDMLTLIAIALIAYVVIYAAIAVARDLR